MYRTEEYLIHQGRNIPKYLNPSNKTHNVSQEESIKKIVNHVEQRNNPQPAIRTYVNLDILNSDLPDFQKNRMNQIYNQIGENMFDDDKYKHAKKRTEKSVHNSMPVNDGAIPLKDVYRYKPALGNIEESALTPRYRSSVYDFDLLSTSNRGSIISNLFSDDALENPRVSRGSSEASSVSGSDYEEPNTKKNVSSYFKGLFSPSKPEKTPKKEVTPISLDKIHKSMQKSDTAKFKAKLEKISGDNLSVMYGNVLSGKGMTGRQSKNDMISMIINHGKKGYLN